MRLVLHFIFFFFFFESLQNAILSEPPYGIFSFLVNISFIRHSAMTLFFEEKTMGNKKRKIKPAETPEARENQLISLAYDVAEKRLLDGSATSQEVVHFLRLGSVKAREELVKLRNENELLKAKTKAIESAENVEVLYKEAIEAMKAYSGSGE
nr:MAG TPA: hypothetical protein [Caudoviricetes sp.]